MSFYLKGVHIPHFKNTTNLSAVKMTAPKYVSIPTSMHIGAPATPIVKVGDSVKTGTLIAEQNGYISSPVYSSISGTVTEISDMLLSNGKTAPIITIESDGEMSVDESISVPVVNNKEDLIAAIKKSGIVGLGGAGFPTYVKFDTDKPINELIINCAECEPYITSDSVTIVDRIDDIVYAIDILTKYIKIDKIIFGIEKNKQAAVNTIKTAFKDRSNVEIKTLPTLYPQGAEKVLIYHTTKKVVKIGELPIDIGCVVSNSSTIAEIGNYLKTGMPLIERCITVDGNIVKEPKNVIVPIGTPLEEVFEFCGGFTDEPKKVLYGGPMMGIAVPYLTVPVLKNTNAILAFNRTEAKVAKTTACIKCGGCVNACPFGINPVTATKALKTEDLDGLERSGVELCMSCGCCSFVCPAKRPIVQNNKIAKETLFELRKKEAKV
ncbi:MAG: electron transport complex subunit RsxC [Clostridia bacterium]|nr:electron transport complex subunit RsxC [Clostridia bacterium]